VSTQHFVAYHNVDQRGSRLDRGRSGWFETNKPTLPKTGDVLWCFEGQGRPRQYWLVNRCVVSRSETKAGGPSIVRYQDADILDAIVNDTPWFERLREVQGRFAFGINPIASSDDVDELERFAAGALADAIEEDVAAIARDRRIPETTRKALIDARRGQGAFRKKLDKLWGHACAATNCAVHPVLRASHIKPWRHSNNEERLDPANGILLSANIDILFDRGIVSFDDSGRMLTSCRLSAAEKRALGLPADLRRKPDARQRSYLAHHRKTFGFAV
jgi:hypothetical protein